MLLARIRRCSHPSRNAITSAIGVCAKERSSFNDLFLSIRIVWIKGFLCPCWVMDNTMVQQLLVIINMIPVLSPFPDITCHIIKTVGVGRKGFYGCLIFETISLIVLCWELSSPGISFGIQFGFIIPPGKTFVTQACIGS